MAEDFHGSADLLFAHGSESVSLERSGWKPPKCGAEVSRLRCEHDRKVAQGVIRRNQLVNSGWLCKTGNPCDLKTPHMYDIVALAPIFSLQDIPTRRGNSGAVSC